jgi:hypothetical protein
MFRNALWDEPRVALAHPPAALVQSDLELEFLALDVGILGGMPGAADDGRRVEQRQIAVPDDERMMLHAAL